MFESIRMRKGHCLPFITFVGLVAASAALAPAAAPKQPAMTFASPVTGLAIERGSLWVSIAGENLVLRLDARTGRRRASIEVHRADARAFGGGSLAAAEDKIWIAAPVHVVGDPTVGDASGWIGRIDRRTLRLKLVQVHGDRPAQVAVGRTGVWVSGGRRAACAVAATRGRSLLSLRRDVAFERFRRRDRHPGHADHERAAELQRASFFGQKLPLQMLGPVVEVDTERPVDITSVAARVLEAAQQA